MTERPSKRSPSDHRVALAPATDRFLARYGRREFMQRTGGAFLATSMVGGLLSACGGDGEQTGEVGGQLQTLFWEGYEDEKIVEPFLKQNDVNVDNTALTANEEVLTKLRAGAAGSVDLASPNQGYVPSQVAAGVLSPVDLDRVEHVDAYIPRFHDVLNNNLTIDDEVWGVPFLWGLDALLYNETRIPEPPTSWMDVMKPEYAGKVLMIEGPNANFEIWPKVIGGYDMTTLTQDQLDETTDFLIELKNSQVRTIAASYDDIANLLANGEVWFVASGGFTGLVPLANEKQQDRVNFTIPEEGVVNWIDALVIPKDAPNLDTAYAWINYVLEPEPQAEFADNLISGTVIDDAVSLVSKSNAKLYSYDDIESLEAKAPVFGFPPPDSGLTTISDWSDAWARVAAA